ncbi:MAG: hypothetical protein LBI99_03965, partial [Propionibacteriaceae bacterium]|nr:hypothetical protein [Propionibacteriaceae bacterium]
GCDEADLYGFGPEYNSKVRRAQADAIVFVAEAIKTASDADQHYCQVLAAIRDGTYDQELPAMPASAPKQWQAGSRT